MKVVKDALELIGNTPLLKLERVTKGLDVNIYVKCEHLKPHREHARAAEFECQLDERDFSVRKGVARSCHG